LGRIDSLFCPGKILDKYELHVNERILEHPFVHRVLDQVPSGSRVLEFGCTNSRLSIELASRGLLVTGVDLRPYSLTHPNFTFYQGDFFELDFPEAPFDVVVAVSAVEHVGLGAYGEDMRRENSDRRVLDAFYHLLRPEGQLVVTVPFGRQKITPRYRIYDMQALGALLQDYEIDRQEYYRRFDHAVWLPVSASELGDVDWDPAAMRTGVGGVACISARRTRDVSQSEEKHSG